ncbi:hypothetical protein [Nocardioides nanhaiensis]|uniref:Htaa domain-containing protein n=1 Tax=Nocardioides nanhaiensis TaxID=1476871 RepID=A0ABP8WXC9_9ACTN
MRPLTRSSVAALLLSALLSTALLHTAPASAADGVVVANPDGDAVVDPTYATTLTVRGSGFQSVRGGHGGIYVFFGTVRGRWRPSQGGASGSGYLYVPDSESRENQGYQRFVAFPGSDTASSANGGTIAADGTWSTDITVPGALFQAVGRNGAVETVDCREVTCGVITVGAHGVSNATNETFTPVRVADLTGGGATPTPAPTGEQPAGGTTGPEQAESTDPAAVRGDGRRERGARPARPVAPELVVDRASASAGNALAFAATGLPPGTQVSAVLDDGAAAAGPFVVGADGGLAGVLTLPPDLGPGTSELRLFGLPEPLAVSFAVTAPAVESAAATGEPAAATQNQARVPSRAGLLFLAVGALALVLALARRLASRRHAQVRRAG